ncbi:MAG: heparin lyase I family protein [Tunicatimonas sp.]
MRKILLLLFVITSCSKGDNIISDSEIDYLFEDGFETQENNLTELFPNDGSRWTNIQQVNPDNGESKIEIESNTVFEGVNSLRVYAKASDNTLSKADIEQGGFNAPEGSTVRIEANFFIASTENIENLLLVDLECCSCWDPSIPNNQCPGIRLMMKSNDFLSIERGKMLGSTIFQTDIAFPRNEWVNIIWEMKLSQNNDGINKLLINKQEVISEISMNMPNANLFEAEFAKNGIDFKLQQPLFYERFQIGATANPTQYEIEIFVDGVKLEIRE